MLKVTTTVYLVSSWHSTSVEIASSYLIAETILVGSVPNVYANIAAGASNTSEESAYAGQSGES